MVIERIPFLKHFIGKPVEASHVNVYGKTEAEKGIIDRTRRWTDKQRHPTNMGRYDDILDDPEVSKGINLLAELIAGVGYYTEMPEEYQPKSPDEKPHKHKQIIDDYGEAVNLDEKLKQIARDMLGKGFCPVEIIEDYDLKILPPEGFYIWRDRKGQLLKYTQQVYSTTVTTWETEAEMKSVIVFINDEDTSHPYGKALIDPIVDLVDGRKQMNKDIMACMHRYGYPTGILQTNKGREAIQTQFEEKEPDEWIFIGNVLKDELSWDLIAPEMRVSWIDYIELIYYQIAEALHAPLLLYLKNATEASATKMLEAVDRDVQGIQRYIKRRVERFLFEPQCGEPVPRLVWGQPKTGLEEIELADIANLYSTGAVKFNQVQDLLKKLGVDLIEPEEEPQPPPPEKQFEQPPTPPIEQILEKLNDLKTQLNVIETNYRERRIPLIKAMRMAGKAIDSHCRLAYPKNKELFEEMRDREFRKWTKRLLGVQEKKPTYKVIVED